MVQTFNAQVASHVAKYRQRLEAVFKQSAQDVIEQAQEPQPSVKLTGGSFEIGKIPVDTSFLRNSLIAGLNGSSSLTGPDSYVLAVASAVLGDTIQAGWIAEYARDVEYGTSKMAGRFFMRSAAQNWQAIVTENAARLRNA